MSADRVRCGVLVGACSDVHANAPALRAVLGAFEARSVDTVVCAGDLLGHCGFPAETIRLVREHVDVTVLGNHDRRVLPDVEFTPSTPLERAEADLGAGLDPEQLDWLAAQPLLADPDSLPVAVAHARYSLADPSGFTTGTDGHAPAEYARLGGRVPGDTALVLGHTHRQAAVQLGPDATPTGAVVNPGSVGDPYDADARYAVIDTADWSVDLAGVAYDTDPVRDEIEGHGESGSGSGSARQGGDGGRSPGHRDG